MSWDGQDYDVLWDIRACLQNLEAAADKQTALLEAILKALTPLVVGTIDIGELSPADMGVMGG